MHALAEPRRAADQRLPGTVAVERSDEEHLQSSAGGTSCAQARRDDLRVVQHQQVAGTQQPRQVDDVRMAEGSGLAVELEETRRRPLRRRLLRDQLGRQRVVEVGELHPAYVRAFSAVWSSGRRMSIGTGKMVVELFSVEISASVWR